MRRLLTLLIVLGLALANYAPALVQAAPGDISVSSSTYENGFPDKITFKIQAKSSSQINKITLRYTTADGGVEAYAPLTITSGASVSGDYTLNTQKNYIPPSTNIRFRWVIEDAAGNSLTTDYNAFDYDDVRFKWDKQTSQGVTVYWYKGTPAFAKDVLDSAVTSIKRLSGEIGVTYERPMKVLVYDNKKDMDSAQPQRSATYQAETITLGVRLSSDVLLLLANQSDLKETLAHELCHMIVHQKVDNPYVDIPSWLDEGLAMVAEEKLPAGFQRGLDDGVKQNALLSVRSMTSYSGDPNKVNLYYGEAYSVVKYMLDTYGRDKMVALLTAFKEGRATDDALRRTYGFTTDELDAKWRVSLGLGPRPGNDSTAKPEATRIPTMVPLGTTTQTGLDSKVGWYCLIPLACLAVLLLAAIVVILVRVRRR
ncbi:MAG: peptidase MA family metallohydrolase [Dehalococcoidia bacterium]|nr:peptidase MA family metallohydrolase [Dehalococcoidia bacterium]